MDVSSGTILDNYDSHTVLQGVFSMDFSPDGIILASGNIDGNINLMNATTGELIRILDEHTNNVNSVAFSTDGTTLISGSSDGTIRLWGIP